MKKLIYLFLAVLFASSSLAGQPSEEVKHPAETKESAQQSLAGYDVPLNVEHVVRNLGSPNRTYVDKNEGCPIGQLHSWDMGDKNLVLLVLGDSYDKKINYSAGSRLIGIKKLHRNSPSQFEGFLDIHLDDSAAEVRRKLDSFVAKNTDYHISQNSSVSPVHRFFHTPKQFKFQYVLEGDNKYIYFIINKQDRLEAVIKASVNVLEAC